MRYGERLRKTRKDKGLIQAQLETLSGVGQSLISQLETSEIATGSEYTTRLARALEISADWLADEIGEMLPVTYSTADPKLVAALKIMEALPEYGKDATIKDLAEMSELIERAKANGADGTNG